MALAIRHEAIILLSGYVFVFLLIMTNILTVSYSSEQARASARRSGSGEKQESLGRK